MTTHKASKTNRLAKRRPPSQDRYYQTHPTISVRLDLDMATKCQEIRAEGFTMKDLIRAAIGLGEELVASKKLTAEEKMSLYNAGHAEGVKEGLDLGFAEGKARYCVAIRCAGCSGRLEFQGPENLQAVTPCLEAQGWRHNSCS